MWGVFMSLCRRRYLTPASLAAPRASAREFAGPRTVSGKARVGFGGLKPGLHAAPVRPSERSPDWRPVQAGYDRQGALYGQIRSCIAQTFGTFTPEQSCWCDGLATAALVPDNPPPDTVGARQNQAEDLKKTKGLTVSNIFRSMNWRSKRFGQSGTRQRARVRFDPVGIRDLAAIKFVVSPFGQAGALRAARRHARDGRTQSRFEELVPGCRRGYKVHSGGDTMALRPDCARRPVNAQR